MAYPLAATISTARVHDKGSSLAGRLFIRATSRPRALPSSAFTALKAAASSWIGASTQSGGPSHQGINT